jgi:hypothetical protein
LLFGVQRNKQILKIQTQNTKNRKRKLQLYETRSPEQYRVQLPCFYSLKYNSEVHLRVRSSSPS